MAEESPRSESAEEDGEEAAEAPLLEGKKRKAPKSEDSTEEEEAAAISKPPPTDASPSSTEPAAYPSTTTGVNVFANDGSFLALFKKKMEQGPAGSKEEAAPAIPEEKKPEPDKRKPISFVGRRRGGAKLALKTGLVAKKPKTDEEEVVVQKGGAWAQYMAEVKKYKAHQCSDDDKTRPLVK